MMSSALRNESSRRAGHPELPAYLTVAVVDSARILRDLGVRRLLLRPKKGISSTSGMSCGQRRAQLDDGSGNSADWRNITLILLITGTPGHSTFTRPSRTAFSHSSDALCSEAVMSLHTRARRRVDEILKGGGKDRSMLSLDLCPLA